jgi:hypothetical protein
MALGDLWEAVVKQEIDGEELLNVFHLEQVSASGSASDIATRMIIQWITGGWDGLVGAGLDFIEIAVRNLFDAVLQEVVPVGLSGTKAGDVLPPHDAVQATTNTIDPTITGSKRFGGIIEADQTFGQLEPTVLADWNTFCNDTLADFIIGAGSVPLYQYVVVKRIPYTTSSGSTAYRLPENIGEAEFGQVVSGITNTFVRTQKSRDFQE